MVASSGARTMSPRRFATQREAQYTAKVARSEYVSSVELAELCGVRRSAVSNWIARGIAPRADAYTGVRPLWTHQTAELYAARYLASREAIAARRAMREATAARRKAARS